MTTPLEASTPPRRGRGLGPFTGRQLTVIAVTAIAATAVPVGAYAVSTARTAVVDPSGRYAASVDANHRLQVGGSVAATVTGTTQLAVPAAFFHTTGTNLMPGSCTVIATAPATTALIVRQVRLDVYQDPTPGSANNIEIMVGDCSLGHMVGDVNPPGVGPSIVTFDPGIGIPPGVHLYASTQGGVAGEAYVDGYRVAASAVPHTGVAAAPTVRRQPAAGAGSH